MRARHALARTALGVFFVLHALAHAALPLRGALQYPPVFLTSALAVVAFPVAVIALFAAGVAILGSRIFFPYTTRLVGLGVVSSVVVMTSAWDSSAWWGLSLDSALVGAYVAARNVGILREDAEAPSPRRRTGRWVKEALACGLVAYVAIGALSWPWHRRWGTTSSDRLLSLPGDPSVWLPNEELMHAVTIDAPPEVVWAWLVQIGQDRAGFYSYDWLERLFLADVHNVYEIRPEWQQRAAGDFVRAAPPDYLGGLLGTKVGWRITHLEPRRAMVLENWGAFVLEPVAADRTRFMIRSSIGGPDTPVWGAALTFALFELPHFVMERKMMLTIKACAERSAATIPRLERSGWCSRRPC